MKIIQPNGKIIFKHVVDGEIFKDIGGNTHLKVYSFVGATQFHFNAVRLTDGHLAHFEHLEQIEAIYPCAELHLTPKE